MSTKLVVILALTVAVLGGWVYWVLSDDETPLPIATPDADIRNTSTRTIAHQWQWSNFTATQSTSAAGKQSAGDSPGASGTVPYDVVEVYKILQGIKLDDHGRLVPDQTALLALERAYNDLGPDLRPEILSGLQDVIRKGLPGLAGEEAASLLENYYRLRLAEAEFSEQLVHQMPAAQHYEALVQLRRNYLGPDIADRLFAVPDAQARHMLAAIAVQKDSRLTDTEKQARLADLQEKLNARLMALGYLQPEEAAADQVRRLREQGTSTEEITSTRKTFLGTEGARALADADRGEAEWHSRFNGFWQARRYVIQTTADTVERERQIEQLLQQYFSPEERERARTTSAEWQARDPQ